jgi:LPLT family lysophospholipid transporter-like MFS transporter
MKTNRDYPLLLIGQFLGAFGDNFLLKAILGPLTYQLAEGKITEQYVTAQNTVFNAVFFVPFIVLAPLAGFVNDRMPKTAWLFGGNALKLLGTAFGLLGVWLHRGDFAASRGWQVAGYALVGIGACMYSPAKYGIIPEIVPAERLVKANGTVEMLTLVAILGGIAGGAYLYDQFRSVVPCYGAALALYAAALIFNAAMRRSRCNASASLGRNVAEFGGSLKALVGHRRLGRILLGCGLFWFTGAVLRTNLQGWGLQVFTQAGLHEITNVKLISLFIGLTLGIVTGSVLAGQIHRTGDLSWTRRYGLLLGVCILLLGLLGGRWGVAPVMVVLVAAGIVAGLLIVPLNAALQAESDPTKLGKTISIQNFIDYFAMLAGAAFLAGVGKFNLLPTQAFVALAATLGLIAVVLRMPSQAARSDEPA